MIVIEGPVRTGTYADAARLLTSLTGKRVSNNQVYMWHQRQARNGFPNPIGENDGEGNKNKKGAPEFDLTEVLNWWANYDPKPKGAPKGNQYALKHGRYAGQPPRGKRRKVMLDAAA